jgi:hypothetical protein
MITEESTAGGRVAAASGVSVAGGLPQAETSNMTTVINTINKVAFEFIFLFLCIIYFAFLLDCRAGISIPGNQYATVQPARNVNSNRFSFVF